MKINTIINRYIFLQMFFPFVVSLLFFLALFLMTKILDITNMVVNYNIGLDTVLLLLFYTIPRFLEFVIPISIMTAVLVTFIRIDGDNEIIACKAFGISIYQIVPPVLLFCMVGSVITVFITIYAVPWGRVSYKKITYEAVSSFLNVAFKERVFNDNFKDVILYVNKIDHKKNLFTNVFINDQRNPDAASTIVAPKGVFFCDREKYVFHLRLHNGSINQVDMDKQSIHSVNFDTYDMRFDLKGAVDKAKKITKKEKEMTLTELRKKIKSSTIRDTDYYKGLLEFHKKFSIPFSCLALGLIAMPLGINTGSGKKSFALGAGLISLLAYYILLSAGFVFGETGFYPPVMGMWIPNIAIGCAGVFLLIKASK